MDDPFEAFFNGGSNYVEVKKTLMTPKLVVDVKALPDGKPSGIFRRKWENSVFLLL